MELTLQITVQSLEAYLSVLELLDGLEVDFEFTAKHTPESIPVLAQIEAVKPESSLTSIIGTKKGAVKRTAGRFQSAAKEALLAEDENLRGRVELEQQRRRGNLTASQPSNQESVPSILDQLIESANQRLAGPP